MCGMHSPDEKLLFDARWGAFDKQRSRNRGSNLRNDERSPLENRELWQTEVTLRTARILTDPVGRRKCRV